MRVPLGSDRLYCCAGGGQISGLRGTLLIENSEFTRIDDDGLDILAAWSRVVEQTAPRTLNLQRDGFQAGDHIALWDWTTKKSVTKAIVASATPLEHGGQTLVLAPGRDLPARRGGPTASRSGATRTPTESTA